MDSVMDSSRSIPLTVVLGLVALEDPALELRDLLTMSVMVWIVPNPSSGVQSLSRLLLLFLETDVLLGGGMIALSGLGATPLPLPLDPRRTAASCTPRPSPGGTPRT